jgi:hypothetical protein
MQPQQKLVCNHFVKARKSAPQFQQTVKKFPIYINHENKHLALLSQT